MTSISRRAICTQQNGISAISALGQGAAETFSTGAQMPTSTTAASDSFMSSAARRRHIALPIFRCLRARPADGYGTRFYRRAALAPFLGGR